MIWLMRPVPLKRFYHWGKWRDRLPLKPQHEVCVFFEELVDLWTRHV